MFESEHLSRAELLEQKRSYWKQHIESWRSSKMTQKDYCQQHDLKVHRFTYWKKRFVKTDTGISFVPVQVHRSLSSTSNMSPNTLRLIVGRDIEIEIQPDFDPGLLRRLLTTIRSLP